MNRAYIHTERHQITRIGWLRAAVLGANDGIVSTASLIIGVAAAAAAPSEILVAGIAGLVAGAMSMAAGEYVSVSSQSDTENADLAREQQELLDQPDAELRELAGIYVARGLAPTLALQVAKQLTANDAMTAHARDELGISEMTTARPIQAALTSAATFSIGAALPLLMVILVPRSWLISAVAGGIARVPGIVRRHRGPHGWCRHPATDLTRHALGRPCHGADRRHRTALRDCGISSPDRTLRSP